MAVEPGGGSGGPSGFYPEFQQALNQLLADAPGRVSINSGFRDINRQRQLWEEALRKYGSAEAADNWVAPPGRSMHNWGMAADLKFENDEVRRWVHANASRYGLHFPLSNEAWHIELMKDDVRPGESRRYSPSDAAQAWQYNPDAQFEGAEAAQAAPEQNADIEEGGDPSGPLADLFGGGGDGGGGGTGSGVGGPGLGPDASPEDVEQWVRENMPQMLWALEHPELGDILTRAAKEGLTSDRIFGLIHQTDWYNNTAEAARQWQFAKSQDPAQAAATVDRITSSIMVELDRLGIEVPSQDLRQFADMAMSMGWTDERGTITPELRRALLSGALNADQARVGDVDVLRDRFKATAAAYFVPMTDETANEWAMKVAAGTASAEAFESYARDLAKSRFPTLAQSIDQGITPAQYFEPYRQHAAQLLEVSPAEIDFMNSPQWGKVINVYDDKQGVQRPMTLAEMGDYVRSMEAWQYTDQANVQASQVTERIGQLFGRVG